MENNNTIELHYEIVKLCGFYQEERISGQWYINQTGLNKISKLLGGKYKDLTKNQRAKFRNDCLENAHRLSATTVKTWWYYLNQ